MNIDVPAPASLTMRSTEMVGVDTDNLRVKGVAFLVNPLRVIIDVEYGVGSGDDHNPIRTELWLAGGAPIDTIMGMDPVGDTREAVLRHLVADMVSRVQNNPTLKQSLLDSGALVIATGDFSAILQAFTP